MNVAFTLEGAPSKLRLGGGFVSPTSLAPYLFA